MRRKMERTPGIVLNGMDDAIGFRVVCESLDDAVALGGRIEREVPARTKNYIETVHGAGTGYRAIYAIARFGQPLGDRHVTARFEIQVRTWCQHLWACWSESFGEQAKEGFTNAEGDDMEEVKRLKRILNDCSSRVARWEEAHSAERQAQLPPFADPYNLAVAWVKPPDDHGFVSCDTGLSHAIFCASRWVALAPTGEPDMPAAWPRRFLAPFVV